MDPRSSSALFKRAEQLKRWEESDTNKQSAVPKRATRIQFSPGIVFLAACTAGDKDEVQRLLKLGADINTSNVDGLTALHQACIDDNFDMVQFLVEHGADVNRGDNEGWTPLHATASCGFASIARHLLENGADVAAVNYDGELAIDIAESDEMEKLLQTAIDEKGVDCEKSRSAEVIKLSNDSKNWAANGYSDVRDPKTGGTPLHVAAAKGYIDVAKTLLEDCNVDPDSVDYEGYTPLHAAALWGQKEAAAILFKFGADPNIKNYSGQTCLDLVDPSISAWLKEAAQKAPHRVNNNVKRTPQKHDVKSVELQINNSDKITIVNDKPPSSEIITKIEGKPPKARPPSPDPTENSEIVIPDEPPSWRRSASFRSRLQENTRENKPTNNNVDTDPVMLRRTHSVEAFYQRYREVTARIKATSCPSIPPVPQITLAALELWKKNKEINNATNDDSETRVNDKKETDTNALTVPTTSSSAVTNNTTTRTTVRRHHGKRCIRRVLTSTHRSFVPPVRDDESETQRKAHAKRVRETRRSTQGVTLDEIKSAEQLVKNKTNNGTTDTSNVNKKEETRTARALAAGGGDTAVSLALACVTAAATATIAPNSERHPSWRLRFDPNNKFELEDANQPPRSTTETEATVTLPLRRPPSAKDNNRTGNSVTPTTEEEKDRESSVESKSSSNASSSSTQAALNVIQRRRRPKRRSTGVGHVDMDDIVNDRVGGSEGDGDSETAQSGSERTEEPDEKDYKALYEASRKEVKQLRLLLSTSEQQLREARATITRLTQVNQNSLSEIEKRERRAMERKLSEMEEELKQLQKLKAENERLRAENRALTRVVSKLTNSAAK
ncbi:protein phosphatase 1 regulatory subunit 12C-like isoform X5 [Pieris napi]|uniref:protein phosphatase 1 regulatory subunit 12C-like isoform X5 n=1 Tax=Pieris napi TaxID=78633 RepID=UPI001FBB9342|nr:protein phosphatase 1 regulatory subunit 12C-like isoform X5 [Pieris napi]